MLHLPGHSPDSIALLDERDGVFFSGDAIYDERLIDDLPDSDRPPTARPWRGSSNCRCGWPMGATANRFDGERMREIARRYVERGQA